MLVALKVNAFAMHLKITQFRQICILILALELEQKRLNRNRKRRAAFRST